MKRTYIFAILPIVLGLIGCLGFYLTHDVKYIHFSIFITLFAIVFSIIGWISFFINRKKRKTSTLTLLLLLAVIPVNLLFIFLNNQILNREYITIHNQSAIQMKNISVVCSEYEWSNSELNIGDSVTFFVHPKKQEDLILSLNFEADGNHHDGEMYLKRKTNGIFSKSVIAINSNFDIVDLNKQRSYLDITKRKEQLANQVFPTEKYAPKTLENHRAYLRYIETEGGLMAYLDLGKKDATPILLVHGVPTSSWLYRHMAMSLVKKGYRVIAPDLLGYGASDKPKFIDLYHPKKQAERLIALMDTLRIEQWTHLMHDAGGLWSGEMIIDYPHRVKNLVFLNTIAYKEGFAPPLKFKYGDPWGKVFVGLYHYNLTAEGWMDFTLDGGIHPDKKILNKEDRRGYWQPMTEGTDQAVYQFFTSFDEIFERIPLYNKAYKNMDIPSLVIWGMKDDALIGEGQIPPLTRDLNTKEENIHRLEDGIHFLQEERPEELVNWIDTFLQNEKPPLD